jgi:hypothetical protein
MIEVSSFTTSPNEAAAIEEINGIYGYVTSQRLGAADHPGALDIIQRFEAWYQGLEESTKVGLITHVVNQTDVNEAKRRREDLNAALGQHLPDDYKPADAPQTPPKGPDYEQGRNPPDDPVTTALKIGGLAAIGFVLYKIFT